MEGGGATIFLSNSFTQGFVKGEELCLSCNLVRSIHDIWLAVLLWKMKVTRSKTNSSPFANPCSHPKTPRYPSQLNLFCFFKTRHHGVPVYFIYADYNFGTL